MALVHQESSYCTKSELDLFTIPPTQLSINHGFVEQHKCGTPLAGTGCLEFAVDGSDDYIDISKMNLFVKVQVVNTDGSNLQDTDIVTPANLFLHSLFNKVNVKLKGRHVCPHE